MACPLSIIVPLLAPLHFIHTHPTKPQLGTAQRDFSAPTIEWLSTAGGKSHNSGDCCSYKLPVSSARPAAHSSGLSLVHGPIPLTLFSMMSPNFSLPSSVPLLDPACLPLGRKLCLPPHWEIWGHWDGSIRLWSSVCPRALSKIIE